MPQRLLLGLHLQIAQPALLVRQRPLQQCIQLLFGKGRSSKICERETSGELTKKNGLCVVAPISRTMPAFDIRQQHILLRLVEPVNLVNEQDRRLAACSPRRLAAVASTRRMSATLDSTPLSRSNLLRVWRAMTCASEVLPGARRPVEDERLDAVGLDGAAQQLPRPEDMRLADKLSQVARPHPRRQRLMPLRALRRCSRIRRVRPRRSGEQVIPRHNPMIAGYHRFNQYTRQNYRLPVRP